ncbi:hypothetical protein ABIB82_006110 [Bradyrhizobium sp. i1.8.4]
MMHDCCVSECAAYYRKNLCHSRLARNVLYVALLTTQVYVRLRKPKALAVPDVAEGAGAAVARAAE